MTGFIVAVIALIAIVIIGLSLHKSEPKPIPSNGQSVLDHNMNEWVMLRALNNGSFLFRSPQGKIRSQTLDEMKKNGFLNQFDFEAIKKN